MKKVLVPIAAVLLIFLIWPNQTQSIPTCPYGNDSQRCALYDPVPNFGTRWGSGYRLMKAATNSQLNITYVGRLQFDIIGRGNTEDVNFRSLTNALILVAPIYILFVGRKKVLALVRRIKTVL